MTTDLAILLVYLPLALLVGLVMGYGIRNLGSSCTLELSSDAMAELRDSAKLAGDNPANFARRAILTFIVIQRELRNGAREVRLEGYPDDVSRVLKLPKV